MRRELLEQIFRCPQCRSELRWDRGSCASCGAPFEMHNGIVSFIQKDRVERQQHAAEIELHKSLAADYDDSYQHEFSDIFSRYWNDQYLAHLPQVCKLVLDCGCGTGDLLRDLKQHSQQVVGVDISEAMLFRAAQVLEGSEAGVCVASPGEKLPFADSVFEAVCYRGALHHMADEVAALREAHRVLVKGGTLMLSEPNDDCLILRIPRKIVNRSMKRFGNDHKAFRSKSWLTTIRSVGFEIRHTKYFSYLSQPLCGMSDLLPLMKMVPKPRKVAQFLVSFDEWCSRQPGIRTQSFDLFVVAEKS